VATFGYRTFTEAIYRVWYGMFDRIAATQLAVVLLAFAFLVILVERALRGRARFTQIRNGHSLVPVPLTGARALAASASCVMVLLLAFGIPVGQLLVWAAQTLARSGLPSEFVAQARNTLWLASLTAAATCGMALLLAYAMRLHPSRGVTLSARFAAMGYALPGAVIAVGVLGPIAWLDRALGDLSFRLLGLEVGLLLTGSAAVLVFAYVVRFLAVSFHTVDASLTKVPRNLDEAARSLRAGTGRTLLQVHVPLIRKGLLAALALVFVDVMKEMPATLLLRPFGLITLAVGVWQLTAESLWEQAAVPALAIVAAGLVPVALALRWISSDPRRSARRRDSASPGGERGWGDPFRTGQERAGAPSGDRSD
jgi:iron(III) transport system permease protein